MRHKLYWKWLFLLGSALLLGLCFQSRWRFWLDWVHPSYVVLWELDILPRKKIRLERDYVGLSQDADRYFLLFEVKWCQKLKHLQLPPPPPVGIFFYFFYTFFFFICNTNCSPSPTIKCQPTCPSSSYPLIPGQVHVIFELTSERLLASHGWMLCVRVCVYCIELHSSTILSFSTPLFDLRGHYF